MSEYRTGLVFRQLALVPFPDSLDFGRCLKSELENPESKEVCSYYQPEIHTSTDFRH